MVVSEKIRIFDKIIKQNKMVNLETKIDLGNGYYLENTEGDYYKGFTDDGVEVKGVILKNCKRLYRDETWELITLKTDGTLDVGPMYENLELFGKLIKRYYEKLNGEYENQKNKK